MKILVNDVAASYGGAMEVLKDFYYFIATDAECKKHQWILLLNDSYFEEMPNICVISMPEVKKNWIYRLVFDIRTVKKIAEEYQVDYVISLQNILGFGLKQRCCVYIHQSIPFQSQKKFSFLKKTERIFAVYQYLIGFLIKQSAKKADVVAVQTHWMKKAVSQLTRCTPEKIVVVDFERDNREGQIDKRSQSTDRREFFYPAFQSIYKNQMLIDQACCELERRGINDISVKLTTEDTYISKLIKPIGRISHDEVETMYHKSVLIFPSYIETIGLPLKEAAKCGTIILAADCEYAHETLANYDNAYYFDPFNATELADLMHKVILHEIVLHPSNYTVKHNSGWSVMIERVLNLGL